jgi:uncharacterized membrane protein YhaH (DUF805 family)
MTGFDWKTLLLSPRGRTSRADFWLRFVLPYMAISIVLSLAAGASGSIALVALMWIFAVIAFWPTLVVGIKRWHDRDKSGWWILIGLVPVIGAIYAFVQCGCLAGTPGPNRFGNDPRTR